MDGGEESQTEQPRIAHQPEHDCNPDKYRGAGWDQSGWCHSTTQRSKLRCEHHCAGAERAEKQIVASGSDTKFVSRHQRKEGPHGTGPHHEAGNALHDLEELRRIPLALMVAGRSNKEIGRDLYVSEPTVKYHVGGILKKLDVQDRTQAVVVAIARGLFRV